MVNSSQSSYSHSSHSNTSSSKGKNEKEPQNDQPIAQTTTTVTVSAGVFQGLKQGFNSVVASVGTSVVTSNVMASTANYLSERYHKDDKEFLAKLTGTDVSLEIKKIVPQLPAAVQKFLPNAMAEFSKSQQASSEKVAEAFIIHIVANLASSLYPDQAKAFKSKQPIKDTISLEQLTHEVTTHVMYLLAEELNEIDQNIVTADDITVECFQPLAKKLITLMLPQNNSGVYWLGDKLIAKSLMKDLPKSLMEMYKPFGTWFTGGDLTFGNSNLQDFIPILEKFGAYTADCMAAHHRNVDKDLLKQLTGLDEVQDLIEILSPQIINGILSSEKVSTFLGGLSFDAPGILERNGETVDSVSISLVLKVISNISREVFEEELAEGKTIPVDEFIKKFTLGVSDIFGTYIRQINQLKNPTAKDFQPLAEHLLKIVLPKDPIVQSFLARRKDRLTEQLSNVLKKSYESIAPRDDTKEYKQRLREVLWDRIGLQSKNPTDDPLPERPDKDLAIEFGIEKLVNQLFNVCHNITNLGRGFVAAKLSDPKVIEEQIYTTLKDQNIPQGLLSGVAGGISQLIALDHQVSDEQVIVACLENVKGRGVSDNLIAEIAVRVKKLSKKSIISEYKILIEQLNEIAGFKILDHKIKKKIAEEIITAMYADNSLYWVTPTIQNALQLTLFKGLVHLLEKVDPSKRNYKELFPAALQIIFDVSSSELPIITNGIKVLSDPTSPHYVADIEEREWCIKELMKPYVDDIIRIFYEDNDINGAKLEDHLPIPDEVKPFVADLIRDNAYKLILPIIEASTSWIDAKEDNRARLEKVYNNSHAAEACRVLGSLASQAIPYSLQEHHETIANGVSKHCAFLFAAPNGKEPTEKDLKKLRKMIDQTLLSLSENNTPSMKALLGFVQNFSESALLRCFADLSECLNTLDVEYKDDPDGSLLVQGTTLLLGEMQEHLSLIAEVKSDIKQYRAGKVPHKKLIKKFKKEKHLHPALVDPSEKDLFFINLSKKIFKIVGVNKDVKLPLPQFLKNALWDSFESDLMPLLLLNIFEQAKDPHTLNLLLINLFQQINATAGNVDVSIPDDEIRKYKDAPQDKLEEISGNLILALVTMQRSSITKWLLEKKNIRDLAGQAMGQPLRSNLEEKAIVSYIDDLIVSLVPSLHPGEWDDANGTYIYMKQQGKKKVVIAEPDFSHILPRTKNDKKACARARLKNGKDAERGVVREITHAIENQTKYIFLGIFRKLGSRIRTFINSSIDKLCGKYAKGIKKVVNKLLDGIANYFIKPFLFITTYPVLLGVRRLLRFYFVHQSTRRAEDVNHKIHENVIYRVVDELLELVGNAKSSHDLNTDSDPEAEESESTSESDVVEESKSTSESDTEHSINTSVVA